jgi:hypothetical protein
MAARLGIVLYFAFLVVGTLIALFGVYVLFVGSAVWGVLIIMFGVVAILFGFGCHFVLAGPLE